MEENINTANGLINTIFGTDPQESLKALEIVDRIIVRTDMAITQNNEKLLSIFSDDKLNQLASAIYTVRLAQHEDKKRLSRANI